MESRIRKAREAKGWRREKLAVEVEVSLGTIRLIELGADTRVSTAFRIAAALGEPMEFLFSHLGNGTAS